MSESNQSVWQLQSMSDGAVVLERQPELLVAVSLVNKYNSNEGIAFKLTISNEETDDKYCEEVSKSDASVGSKKLFPITKGTSRITVEPLPPSGQSLGPKQLDASFSKEIIVDAPSSVQVLFEVTRKQSILHNIPMKFNVKPNPAAKSGEPVHELECMSQVAENREVIDSIASQQKVDPDLVKAIIYMETTHGWYDKAFALVDKNSSVLPMNIRTEYWSELGWTREQLKNARNNIEAGTLLLKRIVDRAEPCTIETVATLYQDLGTQTVTNYGARVNEIYRKKLWIPAPTMLEQIQQQLMMFNNANPMQQVEMLQRMFGG